MKNPYEEILIKRIKEYQIKEQITQTELAKRLEWRIADLNDILKSRRPLGKNRQIHVAKKLGISLDIDQTTNLDNDDLEIAEMAHHLTKSQKQAIKAIIHEFAKKESEAA